jgi:hypothetical protein
MKGRSQDEFESPTDVLQNTGPVPIGRVTAAFVRVVAEQGLDSDQAQQLAQQFESIPRLAAFAAACRSLGAVSVGGQLGFEPAGGADGPEVAGE